MGRSCVVDCRVCGRRQECERAGFHVCSVFGDVGER
jgi:hypothetical protein